ncbi:hypothetical protein ACFTY7_28890, partial [Streptomyces sp. NPDC057062]
DVVALTDHDTTRGHAEAIRTARCPGAPSPRRSAAGGPLCSGTWEMGPDGGASARPGVARSAEP